MSDNNKSLELFKNAMKTLENGIFKTVDLKNGFVVKLKYTRAEFLSKFRAALSKLPLEQQHQVAEYYGLKLNVTTDNDIQIDGYLKISSDIQKDQTADVIKIIEDLRKFVINFTQKNEISIKNFPELEKVFSDIIKVFPELLMIIGKKQHKTHSYTVDIHTLNVLQEVMKNSNYEKLSENDKLILQISVLLHDYSKTENFVDKKHPEKSAEETKLILKKINISEIDKQKIYKIIKNHDWLEKCNLHGATEEEKNEARIKFAKILKEDNLFELSKILTEADLKSVSADGFFYEKYKEQYMFSSKAISNLIKINKQE